MGADSTIDRFRRERLAALVAEVFDGNRAACGRALGYRDGAYVRQLIEGERPITEKTIEKIEALPGAVDWFSRAAPGGSSSNVAPIRQGAAVPLLSWVRAGRWCESQEQPLPDSDEWLPCPVRHSPRTYALRVMGDSMDGPGGYREGEIIFVDPAAEALPGRDVVVRAPDGTTTFKRLKEDSEGRYLLALNPAFPDRVQRVPAGTMFCGVVIGSFVPR